MGTEGLGRPSRGGTMGNQVAPVMAVRKSPPPNCDSGLREKRLYHLFMLVLANIGIT